MAGHVLRVTRADAPGWLHIGTFQVPQLLKLLILAWTLTVIAADWRTDLVEPRRRLRAVLLIVVGLYCAAVVTAELVFDLQRPPDVLLLLHSAVAASLTLFAASWLARLPLAEIELSTHATASEAPQPADAGTAPEEAPVSTGDRARIDALQRSMSEGHVYRDNGLSIGQLANLLNLPEHRLRQLINRHLGYRNFSEFLNHYRLEEAAQRLRDPAQAHLPILTIALECGYSSMPPFNRAFKARFEVTPSQYRQQT